MDAAAMAESALRENIARKGNNSYYFAHASTPTGPAWDGKEEPRLLAKSDAPLSAATSAAGTEGAAFSVEFATYAWTDEKKSVKIYIDFPEADTVADADITCALRGTEGVEFFVKRPQENKCYKLVLDPLHAAVESVTYKKKTDKFVLSLKKDSSGGEDPPLTWYQLKKK